MSPCKCLLNLYTFFSAYLEIILKTVYHSYDCVPTMCSYSVYIALTKSAYAPIPYVFPFIHSFIHGQQYKTLDICIIYKKIGLLRRTHTNSIRSWRKQRACASSDKILCDFLFMRHEYANLQLKSQAICSFVLMESLSYCRRRTYSLKLLIQIHINFI